MLAPMPNQINYAHHEMDPVLMRGNDALIFIHGHWQSMNCSLAFSNRMSALPRKPTSGLS